MKKLKLICDIEILIQLRQQSYFEMSNIPDDTFIIVPVKRLSHEMTFPVKLVGKKQLLSFLPSCFAFLLFSLVWKCNEKMGNRFAVFLLSFTFSFLRFFNLALVRCQLNALHFDFLFGHFEFFFAPA